MYHYVDKYLVYLKNITTILKVLQTTLKIEEIVHPLYNLHYKLNDAYRLKI